MTLKQCLLISASILILGASAKNNAQVKGNKPYELSCFRITEERINLPPMGFQDSPKIRLVGRGSANWNGALSDTPRAKYLRFYTIKIDTLDYMRSIDTLLIVKDIIGGRLFYDDALFWKDATIRALQRIDSRVQVDSVKIQGGRK